MPIRLYTNRDEIAHFNRLEQYARQVRYIYDQAIKELQRIAEDLEIESSTKPFSFSQFPQTRKRVANLVNKIVGDVTVTVNYGMFQEWEAANNRNDELVNRIFQTKSNKQRKLFARYKKRNIEALHAFQNRKEKGLGLSDRIWKNTKQFQQELELALSIGISEGKSAAALTREVRHYLQEPNNLFRKVRDQYGQLQLSKAAEAYHPGRGVYRSSFKNAMRLARTETNMAYRASDYYRWQQMDFIVGFEVKLSNAMKHCPVCTTLAGVYPKQFKFVGWHPQCMCYVTPILMADEELDQLEDAILNNEPFSIRSVNEVTDVPGSFKNWVNGNRERIKNADSTPYFIQDNFKNGDINKGFSFVTINKIKSHKTLLSEIVNLSAAVKDDTSERIRSTTDKLFELNLESKKALIDNGFRITGALEHYNELLSGFDLVEFDRVFSSLMQKNNIKLSRKVLTINKDKIRFDYMGDGMVLVRSFYINPVGLKEVHHDFFVLPKNSQATGLSKKVFQELYKNYMSAGIEIIDVQANIDVGGYTWARYGFMGKSRTAISGVIKQAKAVLNEEELRDFNAWLRENDKIGRYNMNDLSNKPYGKELLLGTNWYGNIDLRTPAERAIFEGYLSRS